MISFVTPYLSGTRWLEAHLASTRKFHPNDEIIIFAPDKSVKEMVEKYGGRFFDGNTSNDYYQAAEFLLGVASNDTVVLFDCDTVLFNNVDYLAEKLKDFDFVAIEERIKNNTRDKDEWERYAPGYVDLSFFMFSQQNFKSRLKDWPKLTAPFTAKPETIINMEPHYFLCEVFTKHYYLTPYQTKRYGLGTLLKDGEKPVLYHQLFGSWEKRGVFMSHNPDHNPYPTWDALWAAENNFLNDYPNPDFSDAKPAF